MTRTKTADRSESSSQARRGWFGPALAGVVLVALVVKMLVFPLLAGVFSWKGLLWSFGLGGSDGLFFPAGVRFVTLAGLCEAAVAVSVAVDWVEGRWLFGRFAHAGLVERWLLGHVTLAWRIGAGVGLAVSAIYGWYAGRRWEWVEVPLGGGDIEVLDDVEDYEVAA